MIIFKWLSFWPGSQAPGLLNTLIFMFLQPGTIAEGQTLFPGQVYSLLTDTVAYQNLIQMLLVMIALICVPWMLLLKPYLLYRDHLATVEAGYETVRIVESMSPETDASAPIIPIPHEQNTSSHGHNEVWFESGLMICLGF